MDCVHYERISLNRGCLIEILFHSFFCNFGRDGRKNRSLYWGLRYRGFVKLRFRCIKKRNTVNSVLRGHLKDRHLPKMDTNMYRRVSSCCSLVILFDSLKENTTRKWMHNHVHLQSGTILVETICPKGLLWHFASLKGENKAFPPPSLPCNVVQEFELPVGNNKHPNFEWRGKGRSADNFFSKVTPIWGQGLNNFVADYRVGPSHFRCPFYK